MTEARCQPQEAGPAIIAEIRGLKDRAGSLRMELYPANSKDFLADDRELIAAGKPFRRVVESVSANGDMHLCMRVPSPGTYALVVIHDRDSKRAFNFWHDGIGVPSNPLALHGRPSVAQATVEVGSGIRRIPIVMEYLHGLFAFKPVRS